MSPTEETVLLELVTSGEGYQCFASLMVGTKLDRRTVRRCCRSLARKGLAEFGKGLWSEDGEPRGSGYRACGEAFAIAIEIEGRKFAA